MFYTYVLKSINKRKFYTGHTNNLEERLGDHNSRKSKYTSRFKPWEIIYSETFETKKEAIQREKYFKSAAGRSWLKNKIGL